MKDLFNEIRADKKFNLETLSYEEIFEGIKVGMAQAISKYSKNEVLVDDLKLNSDRCVTRFEYAPDMNLYPKIYLDLKGYFSFELTPFEIKMFVISNRIEVFSCAELRECFYNFMVEQFPDSDYEKKFEKYFINVEIVKKQREKHLFL